MSIAFERSSGDSIQSSGYMSRFMGGVLAGNRRFSAGERRREEDDSSSSSSSIGRNSDEDSGEESEVQSSIRGPLHSMGALEEVLPIKKGISKFYNGKSKSFTSLADASSASSVKDFVKPENPYTRKRKNLLARNIICDDNFPPKDNGSCVSKRPATSMNCPKSKNKRIESQSMSSSSSSHLPPLHPRVKTSHGNGSCLPPVQRNSNWRSFSLSDLQCAAAAATSNN
ncbi:protein OXIDATIVE STRESS 3 LIKE 2-like [Ricinus communis]|uniref:protein OXIDATIVE STRESS 3 LIKE 2-like n=1 Tax=Ricinus communis TaxID=3988 RepID=UPI0007729204|nr:protein OXIDATIVE STRESS 3 LIKE 2-like [Ricinus communis]|eukprot:XP_015572921.1 uncharacterized protein LOC107261018 [Ricinus communis]